MSYWLKLSSARFPIYGTQRGFSRPTDDDESDAFLIPIAGSDGWLISRSTVRTGA